MQVDVPFETVHEIVTSELLAAYTFLGTDLENHAQGKYVAVFSTDVDIDIKEIKKLRKALRKVMAYFGKVVDKGD